MSGEQINQELRDHQLSLPDWVFAEWSMLLHDWVPILNHAYDLNLSDNYPVIHFAKLSKRTLANYNRGRDSIGCRHAITFNLRYIGRQTIPDTLATLAHELCHMRQEIWGTPPSSRSSYHQHNEEFIEEARECGLLVHPRGFHTGVTPTFTDLLASHGVYELKSPVTFPALPPKEIAAQPTRLNKYICQCKPKPWIIRCADNRTDNTTGKPIRLKVMCDRCHAEFVRAEVI